MHNFLALFLKKILAQVFFRLLALFSRPVFQTWWEKLFFLSLLGRNYGLGSLPGNSGESQAIQYVLSHKQHQQKSWIFFDVGANVGQYATFLQAVLTNCPKYQIEAFEPALATYKQLVKRVAEHSSIHPHNLALGDSNQKQVLFSDSQTSMLASLYQRKLAHLDIQFQRRQKVQVGTIDQFMKSHQLSHIDFLKLDVEGHELAVLKGAKKSLAEQKIDYIQFEFGGCNIDSRTFFKDFYDLLTPQYHVYRILQHGMMPIRSYDEKLEIFTNTNYFAQRVGV